MEKIIKSGLLLIILLGGFNSYCQFITNSGIDIKNSSLVITNGSWTNDAGTTIQNNGIIQTSDSFTNSGALSPLSSGGFVLQFATDLNFQPGGSQLGFLVKQGAGAALTTGTLAIKDSLILKTGVIRLLSSADTVLLGTGVLVSVNPTSNTYVDGMISRSGTGNLLFPFGKNGLYLPLTLNKMSAQKVTAIVVNAPTGYGPGPGVDSLINFPYVWKVQEKAKTDTAAYVEVNYPSTLPIGANPIIVREVSGKQYASMGARLVNNTGGRVTVRSYSRGLIGMFTVANGFAASLVTDSLALVALYNSTGGPSWTTRTNWLSGDIDTWSGVTVNGQSITALNLTNNKLTGAVPDPLVDINAIQTVNLSGNAITAIPDFTSNKQVTSLNVSANKLNFTSLEPNATVPGLIYSNQADLGTATSDLVPVGSPVIFSVNAGGASSIYSWKRNGQLVSGANSASYSIPSISRNNMGEYVAEITNPKLPGLTLKSAVQKTLAYANISGKLFAEPTIAATKGKMTLFKVKPLAYDTIANFSVLNDGSFIFEKVVLDNYELLGFADTVTYQRALPTYYKNTIFWEEADTIYLENNLTDLAITSNLKPLPSSGRGLIMGYLEEDDGTGRKKETQKAKRVSGAGASVRRVERTGRGQDEILTLVAYVYTNENGEFMLPNLPVGEYRLNIQYPGYPMDETSYITIPIGTGLQSQVNVEALVENGKINVKKLIITGLLDEEHYSVGLYPNPAVDYVHLTFKEASSSRTISIMDGTGQILMATTAEQNEAIINVSQFSKGMYILKINENGIAMKTFKISIE